MYKVLKLNYSKKNDFFFYLSEKVLLTSFIPESNIDLITNGS